MRFYEILRGVNTNEELFLVTLLTGECAGEKGLLSHSELQGATEGGFLEDHKEELLSARGEGILNIGGEKVFFESFGSDKTIVICGGGHVSIPVIKIAKMLGFFVTVIEDRPFFAANAEEAGADTVICDDFSAALSRVPGDADTFFVIVTRGHRYDKDCLRLIALKKHAYIGMIGSRRRTALVREDLKKEGLPVDVLDAVHTPIGLAIGAETPEEIGVAIMAEIIEVKNRERKSGGISKEIMRFLLSDDREQAVLATVVERKGSAPRETGAKMLILRDGRTVDTIGGGCMEAGVIREAGKMLREKDPEPRIVTVDLTNDDAQEEGMVCGGEMKVFLELCNG